MCNILDDNTNVQHTSGQLNLHVQNPTGHSSGQHERSSRQSPSLKKKKIYLQAQLRGDLSNVQPVSQQCDGHVLTTTAADNSSL